jgi:acyl-CoA synthetase (AMP-forming)/AMP-acid ligase II
MRLHDYLDFYTAQAPDSEFAVFNGQSISYTEANDEVNRLANALVSAGLEKGDRFGYLSKNSLDYVLMYYAASKAGVVPVPLNYRLAPPEWAYILNDSQSSLLITSAEYQEGINGIRGELETINQYFAIDGDNNSEWREYRQWVADQPSTSPDREISTDDDLNQMYTSGTTGHPKGVVVTHSSVCINIYQTSMGVGLNAGERCQIVVPLYHAAGGFVSFLTISMGGSLYIQEEFIPEEVVNALSEEHISFTILVPSMIQACLVAVPDIAERNYPDLQTILYAASPIAEQTLRRAMDVFKCEFIQAYGMTELSPLATIMTSDDHRRALKEKPELLQSTGRTILGTEIRIVDEDDNPLANGEIGEIIVRGPQVMKGYSNMPEATSEATRGGWMHTGDAGIVDDEGFLYIRDRVNDMIVSGGENVYPNVIENTLFQHPSIADVAVIGVPDEQWGETVKAVIVLRDGASTTGDEIMDFCRGKLGGFERPRSVDFIDALPRNASGKVLKRELREPYWEGYDRRVAGA